MYVKKKKNIKNKSKLVKKTILNLAEVDTRDGRIVRETCDCVVLRFSDYVKDNIMFYLIRYYVALAAAQRQLILHRPDHV